MFSAFLYCEEFLSLNIPKCVQKYLLGEEGYIRITRVGKVHFKVKCIQNIYFVEKCSSVKMCVCVWCVNKFELHCIDLNRDFKVSGIYKDLYICQSLPVSFLG